MLKASVITLTFNRPDALRRCLESLSRQTLGKGSFELVLVDVSDVAVTEVVEEFKDRVSIQHVLAENKGVAANRNLGARTATASLAVFIDDDCTADPDWLEKIVACADANPGALIGGGVLNMNPRNAVSTAGQVITDAVDLVSNSGPEGPMFFPGMNFAVPREDYLALGGCDESYGKLAAEDREFMARWRLSGRALVAAPDALVTHEHRRDLKGFVRQYFNYGKGAWVYHQRTKLPFSGSMGSAVRTHLALLRCLGDPMSGLGFMMKAKVVLLLMAWEVSNLAGFVWQSATGSDLVDKRKEGA